MASKKPEPAPAEIPPPPAGGRYRWDESAAEWIRIGEEGAPVETATPPLQE